MVVQAVVEQTSLSESRGPSRAIKQTNLDTPGTDLHWDHNVFRVRFGGLVQNHPPEMKEERGQERPTNDPKLSVGTDQIGGGTAKRQFFRRDVT